MQFDNDLVIFKHQITFKIDKTSKKYIVSPDNGQHP